MQGLEVGFHPLVGLRGRRGRRPEERVVVGEEGEEDAKEEGRCCCVSQKGVPTGHTLEKRVEDSRRRGGIVQQRMRNVANADCRGPPHAMTGLYWMGNEGKRCKFSCRFGVLVVL